MFFSLLNFCKACIVFDCSFYAKKFIKNLCNEILRLKVILVIIWMPIINILQKYCLSGNNIFYISG